MKMMTMMMILACCLAAIPANASTNTTNRSTKIVSTFGISESKTFYVKHNGHWMRFESEQKYYDYLAWLYRDDRDPVFTPKGDQKCRLCKGSGLMVARPNATLDNPKNWCKCVRTAKKKFDAEQKALKDKKETKK